VIQQWTGVKLAQVVREQVDSSDPTGVYKAIREFAVPRKASEILLDITGGKKSMVGGAAMAGNFLGIDTGYVDYERYLSDLRQTGARVRISEYFKKPVLCSRRYRPGKAKEAFNQYNFSRCLDILNCLEERVEDIWGIRKFKSLAEMYIEIDRFDFSKALVLVEDFIRRYSEDQRLVEMRKSV